MPNSTAVEPEQSDQRLLLPGAVRMSELIAALSTALDLTEGQPPGHAARSCLIGMRIARQIGIPEQQLGALYYALLLKDLGCSSNASKMCWLFGADDRIVKKDLKLVDWTKATKSFKFALSHAAPEASPIQKALQMAVMAQAGQKGATQLVETRCERGADIARMLQLPEATASAIRSLDEHWNGKGQPYGLSGEEIPIMGRILGLAQTVEVFYSTFGFNQAIEIAIKRSGKWFDPQLVEAFLAIGSDDPVWHSLEPEVIKKSLHECEPEDDVRSATEEDFDRIASAFAKVVDAKSPWTYRHSEGVAEIAAGIATVLGFSPEQTRDIRRAGLLHDIGKLGVSNMILDKPGRPTDKEYAEIRKHPDFSKQILDRVPLFQNLSDVAAAHHERLDGNGYHRRLPGDTLRLESRLLAVADVCEALSAKRPYRDELPREQVREIMQKDLGEGLCPTCFNALDEWWDRSEITPRVGAQLEAIERLHSDLPLVERQKTTSTSASV